MLKLKFFASLRESLDLSGEELALPAGIRTLGELRGHLASRGGEWARLTESKTLRCAVNQEMANDNTVISANDEIAFFPPVTGG